MTTRLQLSDAYRQRWIARVIEVTSAGIVLDQSCFFGPDDLVAADRGWIAGREVIGVRQTEHSLTHLVAPSANGDSNDRPKERPLNVGDLVECAIDWPRRQRIMRLHSAQHLVAVAATALGEASRSCLGRVTEDEALVLLDFSAAPGDAPAIGSISNWIDTVIDGNLSCAVTRDESPPFARYWHLDGYGSRRCDALHFASTAEIGRMTLSATSLGAGMCRIAVRAMSEYRVTDADGWNGFSTMGSSPS